MRLPFGRRVRGFWGPLLLMNQRHDRGGDSSCRHQSSKKATPNRVAFLLSASQQAVRMRAWLLQQSGRAIMGMRAREFSRCSAGMPRGLHFLRLVDAGCQ